MVADLKGHHPLTDRAYRILEGNLISYGNVLSIEHKNALYELLMNYTKLINGEQVGRFAFGLDTGMGKTESVVALIAAIHQLKLDHVSILVCQSKVEGLCELKRKLLNMGVPEDSIGLIHSYQHDPAKVSNLPEGYASLPCTSRDEQRQFQLVTHNRVKGVRDISKFNSYQDEPRTLAIWDESLLVSDALSITEPELIKAVHNFKVDHKKHESYKSLLDYLDAALTAITTGLDASRDKASILKLNTLDSETQSLYRQLIGRSLDEVNKAVLLKLIDISSQELKLLSTRDGQGVITYQISVPSELNKVAILDASWWIRELERLDDTIQDVTTHIHPHLKKYSKVTVHQMMFSGSRTSITHDLGGKSEQRKISKELASVIKPIPSNQAVLVFTYKKRGSSGVDFVKTLKVDLNRIGIDTDAMIEVTQGGKSVNKPRINFLTWGSETSLNEFSYCSNVILAGILHRSHLDIGAAMTGQSDNLALDIQHGDIKRVMDSEIAHLAFQALSRGSCRKVNDGCAEPMNVWIVHKDLMIKPLLEKVMSGVKWKAWDEVDPVNKGIIGRLSLMILGYLDSLDDKIIKVSSSGLRKSLECYDINQSSWKAALKKALSGTEKWSLEQRSVARNLSYGQYFTD